MQRGECVGAGLLHPLSGSVIPPAATHFTNCFHSAAAMSTVQAACTVRVTSGVYTQIVRRIP